MAGGSQFNNYGLCVSNEAGIIMSLRGSNLKPKLKKIVVFGSNSYIGSAVARYITSNAPEVSLRLVVRTKENGEKMCREFPDAEIVLSNYMNVDSLKAAVADMDGAFIVTPDFLDEQAAMGNFVKAAKSDGDLQHIVRIVADPPGMTLDRVPPFLRNFGGGSAVKFLARNLLRLADAEVSKKVIRMADRQESRLDGTTGLLHKFGDLEAVQHTRNTITSTVDKIPMFTHVMSAVDESGMSFEDVIEALRGFGDGTAVQHLYAKEVLSKSGLPITYVNIASYFMQNFETRLFRHGLEHDRTLYCPRNRRMGFLDTEDMGACAAAILLSDNHRHIGQTYHLDNGSDVMWFDEVAELMAEVWGVDIAFDGSDEGFTEMIIASGQKFFALPMIQKYGLGYFQFEQDNETIWRKTDIVEYLTGRKAKTLTQWLKEQKHEILGIK